MYIIIVFNKTNLHNNYVAIKLQFIDWLRQLAYVAKIAYSAMLAHSANLAYFIK